jgi:hypothetical protein
MTAGSLKPAGPSRLAGRRAPLRLICTARPPPPLELMLLTNIKKSNPRKHRASPMVRSTAEPTDRSVFASFNPLEIVIVPSNCWPSCLGGTFSQIAAGVARNVTTVRNRLQSIPLADPLAGIS